MEKAQGWDYLHGLGKRYHELVQKGYGLEIDLEKDPVVDTRTKEQKRIVGEIVTKTQHYMTNVAGALLNGGWEIPVGDGEKRRLSLQGIKVSLLELVNAGSEAVIENFSEYDPKFAISTYIGLRAAAAMYREGLDSLGLFKMGVNLKTDVRKILATYTTKDEAVERIMRELQPSTEKGDDRYEKAIRVYKGIQNRYVNMHDHRNSNRDSPSVHRIEEHIADPNGITPEEESIANQLTVLVERALENLTKNERKVVEMRFGLGIYEREMTVAEIKKEIGVTGARVHQIKAKGFRKMRHPFRSRVLADYLYEEQKDRRLRDFEKMREEFLEYKK